MNLLVVDDEPDLRTLYELTLVREGYEVECAGTVGEAWELLQGRGFHALITDMRLPDGTGMDLLKRLEAAGRPERAIVITAYGSAENAVEALKAGAFDYLTKPVDLKQFRAVVASAVGRRTAAEEPSGAVRRERQKGGGSAAPSDALERLVGSSPAMSQVRALVEKVSRSMAPVLVQGESGTGKELVARAVHACSTRASGPFVAVNCGAIPENLLEAEFFGYRKGAFTGAAEDREGFFQAAQGGTLFLDEIGDLPLAMQSKLLRVIQERAVRPVGAVAEVPTQVRIVSATHKDLAAEVQAGRFRQDLFYRLNVIRIGVPPLRERLQDLPLICEALLRRMADDAGVETVPVVAAPAMQLLQRQAFAGNVRELENLLHRALAMSGADRIEAADLGLGELAEWAGGPAVEAAVGVASAAAAAPAALAPLASGSTSGLSVASAGELPSDLVAYLDDIERDVLHRALQKHRYNRTAAGESLGLSLRQMRYRMARLGVLSEKSDSDRGEAG
ncbi:MAG: sigma-54-dependent Fis family transcriptional regulator [Rubrivivax sp.]|nr:sigma-54-dependent Fis family transcriptional regulator [Rubrivivax sp.]